MDRWPSKDPSGVADYTFAFDLDTGDTIAGHTASVEAGDVVIDSTSASGNLVTIFLSGGTDGSFAIVTAHVITGAGREFDASAFLYIRESSRPSVSLTRAKEFLRVTQTSEDNLISGFIHAATHWVENYIGQRFGATSITEVLEAFPAWIDVNVRPLVSVTSISYVDADGNPATVSNARPIKNRIYAPEGGWPSPKELTPITLVYQAGLPLIPEDLEVAILLLTAEYYDKRSSDAAVPDMVEMLCRAYRQVMV